MEPIFLLIIFVISALIIRDILMNDSIHEKIDNYCNKLLPSMAMNIITVQEPTKFFISPFLSGD
jgi:hypothetical protein